MSSCSSDRRVIEVGSPVAGSAVPAGPRLQRVRPRKVSDYPHLSAAHRDMVARYASPLLLGPPVCDQLVALVEHLLTEEEAGAVRHLGLVRGRTAVEVARAEHRPVEQVEPILHRLVVEKSCITAGGPVQRREYRLLPIMPGTFEMVLIRYSPETLTPWHRRFVELFEALYETGYAVDYAGAAAPFVRYLPVGRVIEAHPMALPTDCLEAVLDQFDLFAVGQCQCRTAARTQGHGCDGPLGNCAVMGQWARQGIQHGWLRQVSKEEMRDIKREAEARGMVNWMMNVRVTKGQSSCSCCGCCCHAMRTVSEMSAPGFFAPPHFRPRLDPARCIACGRCAARCPMKAVLVDVQAKSYRCLPERCIGCGQCVLACDRQRALSMEAVPDYKLPYKSWFRLLGRVVPGMLRRAWRVSRERKSPGP
ncbi:MAG: 4Fe-4S dicluster domain-containing protein [Thermoguttaceae bacterium]